MTIGPDEMHGAMSAWAVFTVTCHTPVFFDHMASFSGNRAGGDGLVTFKDSNGQMSTVRCRQPHCRGQPARTPDASTTGR